MLGDNICFPPQISWGRISCSSSVKNFECRATAGITTTGATSYMVPMADFGRDSLPRIAASAVSPIDVRDATPTNRLKVDNNK